MHYGVVSTSLRLNSIYAGLAHYSRYARRWRKASPMATSGLNVFWRTARRTPSPSRPGGLSQQTSLITLYYTAHSDHSATSNFVLFFFQLIRAEG